MRLTGLFFLLPGLLLAQEHSWGYSHADVARKVQEKFKSMKSYTAQFSLTTVDGGRKKEMSGTSYYQNPGKVRFAFDRPAGDLIISDGRLMWIYIKSLNAAGKQDLRIKKTDENGRAIFLDVTDQGLVRLFKKYHYFFDTTEQPRKVDGKDYFVFILEQREKIGGYEKIRLFVDASSYLIYRAIAEDAYGKTSTITLTDYNLDAPLEGSLFQFKPDEKVRIINNPLVND